MAHTPATVTDFRGAFDFVSLAGVSDVHIEQALSRGEVRVTGWAIESDAQLGAMLYAAHELTIAGLGSGADANIHAQGLSEFQTIKSGGLTVSRTTQGGQGGATDSLQQTRFGKRYLQLARINVIGPRVARSIT